METRASPTAMNAGRNSIHIRWSELRLAAVAAVAFGALVAALLPGVWPLMPFPEPAPVEIVALIGFLFGCVLRRTWMLALPFTVLVAVHPARSGFAGSIIAFLVLSPFAGAGGVAGMGLGRWFQHRQQRRKIRAAIRPARIKPPDATDSPITATRAD